MTDLSTSRRDPVADELCSALTNVPRTIPPRWLYDDLGSELFTQITRLPEYYPTETERRILTQHAAAIAEISEARTVIELGAGTGDKTRTLLDAFIAHGTIERFAPLDVSEQTLLDAAALLGARHPEITVEPIVGDFTHQLGRVVEATADHAGDRLVVFLGGTIGNFYLEERRAFLGALSDVTSPGDHVLIGIDRWKPVERILDAYDDAAGVTERFIRNALTHINNEFDGDIDAGNFEYAPLWDARQHRVDMRLRAAEPMTARLDALDLDLSIAAGEELRVEISTKFDPDRFGAELDDAGFIDPQVLTDDDGDFALVLARRR